MIHVAKPNLLFARFGLVACIFLFYSCSSQQPEPETKQIVEKKKDTKKDKPHSSYQDTLQILTKSAVFYKPDSVQMKKIESVTEKWIFDGSMHEYFFMARNAHIVLKKSWPGIHIIDAYKVRYLLFLKADKSTVLIDLDKYNDAYGLFVFDRHQDPRLVDMTNIDSQLPDYFVHKAGVQIK